ncbi:HEPN domain-containing protein [Pedobacter sp. SD-b]|uniref:HEPN domain-containing protein n=1 Tax=Pedobacter segetis TaxID=2793069 RepID=A0ABS1BKD5_9SPHI|nr:HEPN domain-containing protein [Pedobacter segetis]MBK0383354.1 HEPN domain-containing protein [Pedobacter segetis]
MNRRDLQELSKIRLREAKVLLDNKCFDGAYYLCGYSIECALKACIAKNTKKFDFPDKKIIDQSYTHDLLKLLKTAGLESELNKEDSEEFKINLNILRDWNETSRYSKNSKRKALDIYNSISDINNGILKWIQLHW